jgi:hypothetical protein
MKKVLIVSNGITTILPDSHLGFKASKMRICASFTNSQSHLYDLNILNTRILNSNGDNISPGIVLDVNYSGGSIYGNIHDFDDSILSDTSYLLVDFE